MFPGTARLNKSPVLGALELVGHRLVDGHGTAALVVGSLESRGAGAGSHLSSHSLLDVTIMDG